MCDTVICQGRLCIDTKKTTFIQNQTVHIIHVIYCICYVSPVFHLCAPECASYHLMSGFYWKWHNTYIMVIQRSSSFGTKGWTTTKHHHKSLKMLFKTCRLILGKRQLTQSVSFTKACILFQLKCHITFPVFSMYTWPLSLISWILMKAHVHKRYVYMTKILTSYRLSDGCRLVKDALSWFIWYYNHMVIVESFVGQR